MSSFSAGMAPAKKADHRDQHKAELHKELAAIEPVYGVTLQGWIGEKTMKEESGGCEIDAEMERLPQVPPQPNTEVRSDDHKGEEIEGNGANGVFERLAGRVDRVEQVHNAKARVFVQKQNGRMQKRHRKSDIAGPIVEPEIVEPMMRPRALRAVAESHEHPEQKVQSNHANGNKADVGGKVEDGYAHGQQSTRIGLETARSAAKFQGR
jgi:hypothetical protein